MDMLLTLDKLLLKQPDFVEICKKEIEVYVDLIMNKNFANFFIKIA